MILGVLGVGHLAAAVIAGLLRSGLPPWSLLLSPRGKARDLSQRHGIPTALDNSDLVERSDVVLLSVRPADAPAAVACLPWRTEQIVISVCAGVARAQLIVAPAVLVRAMPFTAAEIAASPTVFFPDLPEARIILERLRPAIALASEADFEVATVSAAVYGWAQDLICRTTFWSVEKGAPPEAMRQLIAKTFVAAGRLIAEKPDRMEQMLAELVTPGGITELGLGVLTAGDQPAVWRRACEAVLGRLVARGCG
jgi:pyrroline-5-carboxylate reductase